MSQFIQELALYVPSVIALNFVTITQHCFNISQSYLWNADIVPCDELLSSAQLKSLVVTYIKSLWSGLKSKVLRFRPFNLRLFFLSSGKLPEAGYEVLFILIGSISQAKLASFSPSAVSAHPTNRRQCDPLTISMSSSNHSMEFFSFLLPNTKFNSLPK